jgi:hypothetical protein
MDPPIIPALGRRVYLGTQRDRSRSAKVGGDTASISAMEIPAAKDAVLFLWATAPDRRPDRLRRGCLPGVPDCRIPSRCGICRAAGICSAILHVRDEVPGQSRMAGEGEFFDLPTLRSTRLSISARTGLAMTDTKDCRKPIHGTSASRFSVSRKPISSNTSSNASTTVSRVLRRLKIASWRVTIGTRPISRGATCSMTNQLSSA